MVSTAAGEPETLEALTHSPGLQAARSQGDDEAPGLGPLQEPFSGAGLDAAVLGLRHRDERQLGASSQLIGDELAQIEHGKALGTPDGTGHAGAAGTGRADEDEGTRCRGAQPRFPSAGLAPPVTAS